MWFLIASVGIVFLLIGVYYHMGSSRLSVIAPMGSAPDDYALHDMASKDMLLSLIFFSVGSVFLISSTLYFIMRFIVFAARELKET